MKKIFNRLEKGFSKVVNVFQFLSNLSLIFIMMLISFDVIGRSFFNKPVKGTFELTELSSALLVFFALSITHRKNEHITIDFLFERFPETLRNWLISIIEFCIAILLLFMASHVFLNGLRLMSRNTTTTDLSLPLYPFLFIAVVTIVIFAITAIFKGINHIRQAVNQS